MGRPLKTTGARSRIGKAKPKSRVAAISTKARSAKAAIAKPKKVSARKASTTRKSAPRVMAQPTKGDLRRRIDKLEEAIAKLRAEAKDSRAKLEEAKRETPGLHAQAVLDRETAERVQQLTAAVERYRGEKGTLDAEVGRLNSEVKRLQDELTAARRGPPEAAVA